MQALLVLLEKELGEPVDAGTPLVSSGIVDSLRFSQIVTVLESHFGITIAASEVGVDNFDTPRQMLAFAESRG